VRGFTIFELVILVAIVSMLAAVCVPAWGEARTGRYAVRGPDFAALTTAAP
jgi:Tfp pilus assembly protein PilE